MCPWGTSSTGWAAEAHKRQTASVVFLDASGGRAVETAAYCVAYREQFRSGDEQGGATNAS